MRVSSFFLFAAITTETVSAQGIFRGRNDDNRVRALVEEVSMSADLSLSFSFGGIDGAEIADIGKAGKSSPTPTKKKSKSGKSTTAQVKGFGITGVDPSLEIVSCGPAFVEVKGSRTAEISPGNILIYVRSDTPVCSSCNPLFRKVQSISASLSGTLLLETTFITVSEMIQVATTPEAIAFGLLPIEPLFICPSGNSAGQGSLVVTPTDSIEGGAVVLDKPPSPWLLSPEDDATSISSIGSCNDNWLMKNSDGRCSFTNCYVGVNGDTTNCFSCKDTCDNGCGPQGSVFNTDGNFGTFDFGPACCNHDFCYSSNTFSKDACDVAFYDTMKQQCPPPGIIVITTILFPVLSPFLLGCDVLAAAFYLAVSEGGDKAQADAQAEQKLHELDPICIAQCPSTQQSGGQGLTVLNIDMLRPSGTFPVSYQMYNIPDSLSIEYEGNIIFNTDGLVSGFDSADVSFSGTSTIVQVTIDAPLAGTAWDVFVGCPI